MAIRNIFTEEDDILLKKSRVVTKFDDRLAQLLDDMKETMIKAEGAGLAAPQVGLLRRVAIIDIDGEILELINPKIVATEGSQIELEGCLSVSPRKNCKVLRPQKVVVEAYDRNGKQYKKELVDIAARACCHELDHLDGILFYTKKHIEDEKEQ